MAAGASSIRSLFPGMHTPHFGDMALPATSEEETSHVDTEEGNLDVTDDPTELGRIYEVLASLDKRLEDQEVTLKAYSDLQNNVLEKITSLNESLENLGNQAVTQSVMESSMKPVLKSLEDIKATLSTMKAVPVMSQAPKRTIVGKEKGKEAETLHENKPNEGQTSLKKNFGTAAEIAERIKRRNAENQKVARGGEPGPSGA